MPGADSRFRPELDDLKMLDVLFDGVVAIDAKGQMIMANVAAARMFGYERPDELVGHNVAKLMPSPERERHSAHIQRYLETGEAHIIDIGRQVEGVRSDGSRFPLDLAVTRGDRDGQPYFLGVLRDLTEHRQTQARLAQAEKLEAIGQLAGGIAHDFNNLLTSILGSAELLLQRLPEADRLVRAAERIHRAAERGASLTQRLLAFGRRQMVTPEWLDVNAAVRSAVDLLDRVIGEDIDIRLELADDAGCINADPTQIDQVIMNLAINSADAMPGGGEIRIRTARTVLSGVQARELGVQIGPHVCISVIDEGSGIEAELLGRIFEPFFTTKEVGRGTGLGLSTVYGIAKQNAGGVAVDSRPGEGSAFHVYWPVSEPSELQPPSKADPTTQDERLGRILLVEDDELVREVTSELLEQAGYTVLACATPAAALSASETIQPDLLVTDVVMPDMTGTDLARRLRERHPELRVLMMSGYGSRTLAERGAHPDSPWLDKPFANDTLLAAVRDALARPPA